MLVGLAPEGVRTAFAKRAAGCPEPYLYDRLFSGSETTVGVEAASAKHEVGESAYFIKIYGSTKCARFEDLRAKQLHQLGLVATRGGIDLASYAALLYW
jgi:hypothetical protein